eukprot:Colp12_sorted_trinity150504_noHs@16542
MLATVTKSDARAKETAQNEITRVLGEYSNMVKELFTVLCQDLEGNPQSNLENPDTYINNLIVKDKELKNAVERVVRHQKFQKQIESLKEAITKQDEAVMELALSLKKAENVLEQVVDDAKRKLEVLRQSRKGAQTVDDLVKYAQRVTPASAA